MIKDLKNLFGIEVTFAYGKNPCMHIKNSYTVTSDESIKVCLRHIHNSDEYKSLADAGYSRTFTEEFNEWKAHNFLYKHGIFRNNTADADIDNNESKFRKFVYALLSRF